MLEVQLSFGAGFEYKRQ